MVLWCQQVALDNTKKKLEVNQPPFEGEVEMDLYTDEQINGGQRATVISDESPRSLTWVSQSSESPATVKTHSNGVTSSSSTSLSTREDIHISTLNCQLTKTSPLESDTTRSSASMKQGKRPCEESTFDKVDSQSHSLQKEAMGLFKSVAEANHFCSCLQSPHICLKLCIECNALHSISCALLEHCIMESHCVVFSDIMTEEMEESRAVSPQGGSLSVSGMSASPTLASSSAAMSSLVLCDDPESIIPSLHPIGYHDCCDLAQLDPQVLCLSCSVFHAGSCRGIEFCQMHHKIKPLGVCSCGRTCARNPLVLCRYCGNEYCRDCWYRNPVVCTCGQTFDQSSSVWFELEEYCTNEAQLAQSQCLKSAFWKSSSINQKFKCCLDTVLHFFLMWTCITLFVSGHIYCHYQHFWNIVYCWDLKMWLHLCSYVTSMYLWSTRDVCFFCICCLYTDWSKELIRHLSVKCVLLRYSWAT